jgi:hypothetical protein
MRIALLGPKSTVKEVGLGDAVKSITDALGIKQWPGCQCKQRQQKLNDLLTFTPVNKEQQQ